MYEKKRQFAYSLPESRKRLEREIRDDIFLNTPKDEGGFARYMEMLKRQSEQEKKNTDPKIPLSEHQYQLTAASIRQIVKGEPDQGRISKILSVFGHDLMTDVANKPEEGILTLWEMMTKEQQFGLNEAYKKRYNVDILADLKDRMTKMGIENSSTKRLEILTDTSRSEAGKRIDSTLVAMMARPNDEENMFLGYSKILAFRANDKDGATHKEIAARLTEAGVESTGNMGDDFDRLVTHHIVQAQTLKVENRAGFMNAGGILAEKTMDAAHWGVKTANRMIGLPVFGLPLVERALDEANQPYDSWTDNILSKTRADSWQRNTVLQLKQALNASEHAEGLDKVDIEAARLGYELNLAVSNEFITQRDRDRLFNYVRDLFERKGDRGAAEIIHRNDELAIAKMGKVGRDSGYNDFGGAIQTVLGRFESFDPIDNTMKFYDGSQGAWLIGRLRSIPKSRNMFDLEYQQSVEHRIELAMMLAAELKMIVDGKGDYVVADASELFSQERVEQFVAGSSEEPGPEARAELIAMTLSRFQEYIPMNTALEETAHLTSLSQPERVFNYYLEQRLSFQERARFQQLMNGEGVTEAEKIYLASKKGFDSPEFNELVTGKSPEEVADMMASLDRGEPEVRMPVAKLGSMKDSLVSMATNWIKRDS